MSPMGRPDALKRRQPASGQPGCAGSEEPASKLPRQAPGQGPARPGPGPASPCTGSEEAVGPASKLPRQAPGNVTKKEELEDAPADSPAHEAVRWQRSTQTWYFDTTRSNGERVRMQTTMMASGGCSETAARIARLCYLFVEQGADKEQVLQYRSELYKKVQPKLHEAVRGLFGTGPGSGGSILEKGTGSSTGSEEPPKTAPGGSGGTAASPPDAAGSHTADPEEDVPADHVSHHKIRWQPSPANSGTFWFEVDNGRGERVRCQTTVVASGGCRETAARIGRLIYRFIERGANREEALRYRSELYRKVEMRQCRMLGLRDVREVFLRKFPEKEAMADSPPADDPVVTLKFTPEEEPREVEPEAEPRELAPPCKSSSSSVCESSSSSVQKKAPKQRAELFRNLRGEVVAVSATVSGQRQALKPWAELEPSDVDLMKEDNIYLYEKELNLCYRRSLEERIARIEQMAQRSTLLLCGKPRASEASLEEALAGMKELASQEESRGLEAQFLKVFLALPPHERRHATGAEVSLLERVAHLEDGYKFTVPERRARLKERVWELRSASAPKNSGGLLQAWAKAGRAPGPDGDCSGQVQEA